MSDYARRHHPNVIARKLAHNMPLLNDYSKIRWQKIAQQMNVPFTSKTTKLHLYLAVRELLMSGVPLPGLNK
jgi:hypothetical protein